MGGANESVIDGLNKAIEAETAGHHFYMMAARSTEDPKGREVFERLAGEELEHVRFLEAQKKAFAETGKPDENVVLGKPGVLSQASPIFSERLRERINEAHYEMSALSIGIELEISAVKYYKQQAEAAEFTFVRDFYMQLSQWESGHYHALLKQQEELKGDYWAQGGFSPF